MEPMAKCVPSLADSLWRHAGREEETRTRTANLVWSWPLTAVREGLWDSWGPCVLILLRKPKQSSGGWVI